MSRTCSSLLAGAAVPHARRAVLRRADHALPHAGERYTGLGEAEQLGWGWLDQVHPQDRERVRASWRAAVKAGTCFTSELRIRNDGGAYRWFRARAVPVCDAAGTITRWYGTGTDVDDLRRTGADGEDRLTEILDHMSEGYLELDRDLIVVSLNRAAAHILEREQHTIVGEHVLDVLGGGAGSVLARELEAARAARGADRAASSAEPIALARGRQRYDVRIVSRRAPDSFAVFLARRSARDGQGQEASE